MPIFWLSEKTNSFPPPQMANRDGVLAIGGDLSPERLLNAYRIGVFPWYNPEDPILWWCPDPRFVLFPEKLKIARSMRPYLNQPKFQLTFDREFSTVMRRCAKVDRKGQRGIGTWISEEMVQAYTRLHTMGFAHSVEVWQEDELVGGLYGIALGRVFFGESMFAEVSNASKFGFIRLVQRLQELGYRMIDCQQKTPHLASLGAESIPRRQFLSVLRENETEPTHRGSWSGLLTTEPPLWPG